jgi:hypothetical protein
MIKPVHTAEQVIAAIKGSAGIKATIARRLDVSRWTIDNYLKRWKAAQLAYDEECEGIIDLAETVLIKNIQDGDTTDAKWYLSRKGRHRGYVERQEVTGRDGEPVTIAVVNVDTDKL